MSTKCVTTCDGPGCGIERARPAASNDGWLRVVAASLVLRSGGDFCSLECAEAFYRDNRRGLNRNRQVAP